VAIIDVEALLTPISDGSPTGQDLRWVDGDTTFSTIEDNRVDEDPALVFEGDPKSADWRLVVSTAEQALTNETKDLQLAVWLTEGLARIHGFEGLAEGLNLTHRLVDQYWETIYPGYDADDGEITLATRGKPLGWLVSDRGFLPSIKEISLANKEHRWSDYERAMQIEQARPEEAQEMMAAGGTSRAAWHQALQAMGPEAVGELVESIERSEAELKTLMDVCNDRFGYDDAPLLNPMQDLLEEIREAIRPHGAVDAPQDDGWGEETSDQSGSDVARASTPGAGGPAVASGVIASRQDALQRLAAVARFFRETEPHSPMAFLIERAVRWGNMSFQQLFAEVVKNDSALAHVWETLGIDPSNPDPGPPPLTSATAPGPEPANPSPNVPPAADSATGSGDDDW